MTKALGFRLTELNQDFAQAQLPLKPNINHKSTLFGGSQYSGCALICYSLFLFGVRAHGVQSNDLVVSEGKIKYLKPAQGDVILKAKWESESARKDFFEQLERKGKARVCLLAHVLDQGGLILSEFYGTFVTRS